jgi:glucose-1-phosphate cytidylyltransferase
MKAVILAGGLGTRLSEETHDRPKPMVEIGGRPILWHIMKMYSHYGINDFIICLGYKGYMIKEYFANYYFHMSDLTIDLTSNTTTVHNKRAEDWRITLIDTGDTTMTGGRLKKVTDYISDEHAFCCTYGDGLSDVNIDKLVKSHYRSNKIATVTSVYPPGRFGALEINNGTVKSFKEKPRGDGALINGGFFVLNPKVLDYIDGDNCVWEAGPLNKLAENNELSAFEHDGFWQPMDTLRDKNYLERLWQERRAPWKTW